MRAKCINESKNKNQAKETGDKIGINWNKIQLAEFTKGLAIEMEHGTRYKDTNITNNNLEMTGKIAWAHLKEFPDYYTRLEKLETQAKKFWNGKSI